MTFLGGSPFHKGQKISPLYMQSLVPRAIVIIEFGAEGDNCAVAKYNATKMADKQSILSRFLNNFRAKIFRKIHRHALAYTVFLYTMQIVWPRSLRRLSFEFFKCTLGVSLPLSYVHGHILGLFVADSDAKDAFRFP